MTYDLYPLDALELRGNFLDPCIFSYFGSLMSWWRSTWTHLKLLWCPWPWDSWPWQRSRSIGQRWVNNTGITSAHPAQTSPVCDKTIRSHKYHNKKTLCFTITRTPYRDLYHLPPNTVSLYMYMLKTQCQFNLSNYSQSFYFKWKQLGL